MADSRMSPSFAAACCCPPRGVARLFLFIRVASPMLGPHVVIATAHWPGHARLVGIMRAAREPWSWRSLA